MHESGHVSFGILRNVNMTKHSQDADSVKSASSCTERLTLSPTKKMKKTGGKGSVASRKNSNQLGCVFQDVEPPKSKSILRKSINTLGPKRTVKFSKGTLRRVKKWERHGLSEGVMPRSDPRACSPYAPKFGDRSEKETLKQERCARRDAWEMAKSISKLKEKDKATFHTPLEVWCLRAPSSTKPEKQNLWWNPGLQCTIAEQERSEFCGSGACSSILNPYNGYHSRWRSANKRGSKSVHLRFGFIRDSTDPRGCASSSIAWKNLRRSRILLRVDQ